jgi:parallel beta-helix repeat protein
VGGSYNSFIENTVNSAEGSQSAVFIWPMASVGGNFISGVGSDNIFRENTITGTAGYGFKIESGDSNILSDNDLASFAAGVAHIYLDEFSEDNCIDGVEGLTVIPAEPVNGNVYYDASGGC